MVLLKDYFYTILPKSVFDNKVSKDIIDVILDYIDENLKPSYDVNTQNDFDANLISEELLSIYLSDVYDIIKKSKMNPVIKHEVDDIMTSLGYDISARYYDKLLSASLNNEHIIAAKDFKQKKGTIYSIDYIYNLVKSTDLQPISVSVADDFVFEAGDLEYNFETIEGSLYEKIYKNVVAYAAHPVGFTYSYSRTLLFEIVDYFSATVEYINEGIQINCISGEIVNFEQNLTNVEDTLNRVTITFEDGTYLVKDTQLIYYAANNTIITEYLNCILDYSYRLNITSQIDDTIEFETESYMCDYVDLSSHSDDLVGLVHDYMFGLYYEEGVIGKSPHVICLPDTSTDVTKVCDAVGLYCFDDETELMYANQVYDLNIVAKCDDGELGELECDGYGVICGPIDRESCEGLGIFKQSPAMDSILITLSE